MPKQNPTPTSNQAVSSEKDCSGCLKGGSPYKKETLSILVVFLVGLATVLLVLLVNEKRTTYDLSQDLNTQAPVVEASEPKVASVTPAPKTHSQVIELPEPQTEGDYSVEEALATRRSMREFQEEPVALESLSQMLWAAQGVTDDAGHRAAPSARGLYPYTLYVVVRDVEGLESGMYEYIPATHSLGDLSIADAGQRLIDAQVQPGAQQAPVVILMSASFGTMVENFPDNPKQVTYLEGGHIGQNLYLQAQALDLGMVTMAGFDPQLVGKAMDLDEAETVIYVIPIGTPQAESEEVEG